MCGTVNAGDGCGGDLNCEQADCVSPGRCGGGGVPNVCGQEACVGGDGGWCWENPRPQGLDLGSVAMRRGNKAIVGVRPETTAPEQWSTLGLTNSSGWQFRQGPLDAGLLPDGGRAQIEVFAHPEDNAAWFAVSYGRPAVLKTLQSVNELNTQTVFEASVHTPMGPQVNRVVALHDGRALLYRSSDLGPPNAQSALVVSNSTVIDAGTIGVTSATNAVELSSGDLLVTGPKDPDNDEWSVGTATGTGTWRFSDSARGDFSPVGRGTVLALSATKNGATAALSIDGGTTIARYTQAGGWRNIGAVPDLGTDVIAMAATDRAAWLVRSDGSVRIAEYRQLKRVNCGFLLLNITRAVPTGEQEVLLVGSNGLMMRCHTSGLIIPVSSSYVQLEGSSPAQLTGAPSPDGGEPLLAAVSKSTARGYRTMFRTSGGLWKAGPTQAPDGGSFVGSALNGDTLAIHEGASAAFINLVDGGVKRTPLPSDWSFIGYFPGPLIASLPRGFLISNANVLPPHSLLPFTPEGDWVSGAAGLSPDAGTVILDDPAWPDAGLMNAVVATADQETFFVVRERGTQLVRWNDAGLSVSPANLLGISTDAGVRLGRMGASAKGQASTPSNYTFETTNTGTSSSTVVYRAEPDGGAWRSDPFSTNLAAADGLFVSGARAWTMRSRSLLEVPLFDGGITREVERVPTSLMFNLSGSFPTPPRIWGDEASGQVWFLGPNGYVMRKKF